jgi:hypothetical protein
MLPETAQALVARGADFALTFERIATCVERLIARLRGSA